MFAAAAEKYVENFLAGFTPDGYCSEGLGYWNYGSATTCCWPRPGPGDRHAR